MERLTLTAGARFISETQHLDFFRPLPSPFYGVGALGPVAGDYSDHATIVKLAVRWAWTDTLGTYASYSTGYKGQGISASAPISAAALAALPLKAENSRLWELGLRSQLFDKRLTLNLTGFLTQFENYQQQAFDPVLGIFVITNAGNVHTNGVELEFVWAPSPQLSISGGLTYLDAGYDFNGPCYRAGPLRLAATAVSRICARARLSTLRTCATPALARYTLPLSAASALYGQVDFHWQSEVQFAYDQIPLFIQHAYGIADFKLGGSFARGRYEASVFVNDAFDQHYGLNVIGQGAAGGARSSTQLRGTSQVSWRQFSVRL